VCCFTVCLFATIGFAEIIDNTKEKCFDNLSESDKDLLWQELVKLVKKKKERLGITTSVLASGHGFKLLSSLDNIHTCSLSFTVTYNDHDANFYDIVFKTDPKGRFLSADPKDFIVAKTAPEKPPEELRKEGSRTDNQ